MLNWEARTQDVGTEVALRCISPGMPELFLTNLSRFSSESAGIARIGNCAVWKFKAYFKTDIRGLSSFRE